MNKNSSHPKNLKEPKNSKNSKPFRVAVVGGGAAGFFGAIACAANRPDAEVHIFEKSPVCLAKVAISGGGRCNATHACFDPQELVKHYPRGARELLGAFHRFQPEDTVRWFRRHGVRLQTEPDGCMFPATNSAATIVNCLLDQAAAVGISVHTKCGVTELHRLVDGGFKLECNCGFNRNFAAVLLATGGSENYRGLKTAVNLGHTIAPPVPSLFALRIKDAGLRALSGIAIEHTEVTTLAIRQSGPLLITHEGLSGPAILRLSSRAARELHNAGYNAKLQVNWVPAMTPLQLEGECRRQRQHHGAGRMANYPPLSLKKRLWCYLLARAAIPSDRKWSALTTAETQGLIDQLTACCFMIDGKNQNKDEFVTCGGVRLNEVNFRTMQSRICPGLYFAGEILDIDGLTGGFNLQAAWTTGWLAGSSMA